ncbi:MAG: tRNA threonylcarbamoyladenosine dehydratase [Verrucomicrobiales bacterium]|nr:tRNA threonylcarbamoyladenosine dehydratase [Verrucomicrobiales bacterium]
MKCGVPGVEEAETSDPRFGGLRRLLGPEAVVRLSRARVAVVGLGGVGSWAVEALARSAVGSLVLVDLDEVCLTNFNRQLPAVEGQVGRFKAEALAERVRSIHTACEVRPRIEFFTEATEAAFFSEPLDGVVDAIDAVGNKARLIAGARARGIPIVACGAAGGRRESTAVRISDLADVTHDRLLGAVRKRLRAEHGFPAAGRRTGVACVHSPEIPVSPSEMAGACAPDLECAGEGGGEEPARPLRLGCEWGYGSAVFVTAAFGLAAAGWMVNRLAGDGPRAG